METTKKPPGLFWVIGILGLIWYILGVTAYISQAYMTEEAIAALPEADQNWYNNIPAWVTAAFATSVFTGLFGCIVLLVRKKWAIILFIISFIAIVAQHIYNFFLQDYVTLSGPRMAMPIIVTAIGIFMIWYSKHATSKDWIA